MHRLMADQDRMGARGDGCWGPQTEAHHEWYESFESSPLANHQAHVVMDHSQQHVWSSAEVNPWEVANSYSSKATTTTLHDGQVKKAPKGHNGSQRRPKTSRKEVEFQSRAEPEVVWGKTDEDDGAVHGEVAARNSEWVKRRREQVAKASRAAREKRKREVQGLRLENQRLRTERDEYLDKIQELQLKVEALREEGSFDIQMENDLLKAQLEEHKKFVSGFLRLASGVPSTDVAKRILYKQGADYAVSHTLSLVSQSLKDGWKELKMPQSFSTFSGPQKPLVSGCYKFSEDFGRVADPRALPPRRLNIRIDLVLPNVDMDKAASLYWDVWTDENEQAKIYNLSQNDCFEFKRLLLENLESEEDDQSASDQESSGQLNSATPCTNEDGASGTGAFPSPASSSSPSPGVVCCTMDKQPAKKMRLDLPGGLISAAYYREIYPPPLKDKDWVFVATKRLRDMARSTFIRPTPGMLSLFSEQANASSDGSVPDLNKSVGAVTCHLMARSTTKQIKAPNHENSQRISSLIVEGCLVWSEVDDRVKQTFTHMTVVLSLPDDVRFRMLNGFSSIITNHGAITEQFGSYFATFIQNVLPISP